MSSADEARVDVAFEQGELAQQRQTERVDCGDGNLAEAFFQLAPPAGVKLRQPGGFAQPVDDAFAHLRSGFARERNRENVIGSTPARSRFT